MGGAPPRGSFHIVAVVQEREALEHILVQHQLLGRVAFRDLQSGKQGGLEHAGLHHLLYGCHSKNDGRAGGALCLRKATRTRIMATGTAMHTNARPGTPTPKAYLMHVEWKTMDHNDADARCGDACWSCQAVSCAPDVEPTRLEALLCHVVDQIAAMEGRVWACGVHFNATEELQRGSGHGGPPAEQTAGAMRKSGRFRTARLRALPATRKAAVKSR